MSAAGQLTHTFPSPRGKASATRGRRQLDRCVVRLYHLELRFVWSHALDRSPARLFCGSGTLGAKTKTGIVRIEASHTYRNLKQIRRFGVADRC